MAREVERATAAVARSMSSRVTGSVEAVAENHVAERIANEQHVNARCLENGRSERIVGGEHREGNALGLGARDVLDTHTLGRKEGGRLGRGRGRVLRLRDVRHGIPSVSCWSARERIHVLQGSAPVDPVSCEDRRTGRIVGGARHARSNDPRWKEEGSRTWLAMPLTLILLTRQPSTPFARPASPISKPRIRSTLSRPSELRSSVIRHPLSRRIARSAHSNPRSAVSPVRTLDRRARL